MVSNAINKADFLEIIQTEIKQVEELMHAQADGYHPELNAALKHLLSSGGKRVRPAMVLLMGKLLQADSQELIILAASIEMLHTATLVHDDLIDGSILRRGIATLNARWSPAATVLTGDFIFAQAAGLAAGTFSVPVIKLFAETLSTIVSGEITQLFNGRFKFDRKEYEKRIYDKTASLFVLCAVAPALLKEQPDDIVQLARTFGQSIGLAFQIVDDVLDFTGEQATVGKPVASDLRQGLITLPTIYFSESHPDDPDMKILLSGNLPDEDGMTRLARKIRESGAIQRSMEEAHSLVATGLHALDSFPDCPQRMALVQLSRYFVDREL